MSPKDRKEDQQLVDLISKGDQVAFAKLYDKYSAALYSICLKILRNEDEAQDALQKSMVKAWKSMQTYDSNRATIFTWLLNVTRNTCIDRIRSLNRIPEIQDIDESVSNIDRSAKSKENQLNVDTIGLREAVDKLKPELRTMIHAAYFGGYTQQEISDKMGIPLGTVKTRIRTAIIELRKTFK